MRRALRTARWLVRSSSGELLAASLPRLAALGLGFVEIDAMIGGRWGRVTADLQARTPSEAVAGAFVAGSVLALLEARPLSRILWGRQHLVVRRQPVPGAAFGPGVMALAAPFVAPLAVWGGLWHGSLWGALLWALPAGFAAVAASRGAPVTALVAAGGGAVVVGLADAAPAAGLPLAVLSLGWVAVAGTWWRARDLPLPSPPRSWSFPLPHPVLALLHRDVLAVVRTAPWVAAGPLLAAAPAAFVARNLASNGGVGPRGLAWGVLVTLAVASGMVLAVPAAAARAVGAQFDPPRWPLRVVDRGASLALLAGATLVPSWAAAAVSAPVDGAGHVRIAGYVLDLAVGAAWWVAARPQRPGYGSWFWWAAFCLLPAAFDGGAVAVVVAVAAGLATARSLHLGRR